MSSIVDDLRRGWDSYQPAKAHAFWIGVGCILATLVVGFGFGGWVSGATARKMVSDAAGEARHQLAAAVCVEDFMRAANAGPLLQKLKEVHWYERSEKIAAGGWATMPDRKEPNTVVAGMCAERLDELPAAASAKVTPVSAPAK